MLYSGLSPSLPERMLQPPGFAWGHVAAHDGALLRYGHLAAVAPWCDCIMVGGFSEFTEKYFEVMQDLAARGLSVWMLDWRGQGGSARPSHRPHRPRARDFAHDVNDLAAFVGALGAAARPRVLMGHSMGGAIALRALASHAELFDAAIVSAPMVAVATSGLPRWLARLIAYGADVLGLGMLLIPGMGPSRLERMITAETSPTSHDPVRARLLRDWFRARPDLAVDGITFGWYASALGLGEHFKDSARFTAIRTPVLMGLAGHDKFVDSDAARDLGRRLPRCRIVEFPDAKHELFHERDDIRSRWFAAIDAFLSEHVKAHAR